MGVRYQSTPKMHPIRFAIAGTGMPDVIQTVAAIEAAGRQPLELVGFLDDNTANASRNLGKYRILGGFSWISENRDVAIFNSVMRSTELRKITTAKLRDLGAQFFSLIHPTASVEFARVGRGCYVGKNVHLEFGSSIGDGSVVLANATIAHDSAIGRDCFLGSGVHVQGHATIEDEVFIGAGTVIHPHVTVRSGVSIDANGVISTDTKAGGAYFNSRMRYIG